MGALTYRMAGLDDAARLAQMNRQLIEDEGSENPMNLAELARFPGCHRCIEREFARRAILARRWI